MKKLSILILSLFISTSAFSFYDDSYDEYQDGYSYDFYQSNQDTEDIGYRNKPSNYRKNSSSDSNFKGDIKTYAGFSVFKQNLNYAVKGETDKYPVYGFNLIGGARFKHNMRADISIAIYDDIKALDLEKDGSDYLKTDVTISNSNIMANGFYEFNMNDSSIKPFATIGLGYASLKVVNKPVKNLEDNLDTVTLQSSNLTYSIGGGIAYNLSDKGSIDISIKYQDLGNGLKIEGKGIKVSGTSISFGSRFNF